MCKGLGKVMYLTAEGYWLTKRSEGTLHDVVYKDTMNQSACLTACCKQSKVSYVHDFVVLAQMDESVGFQETGISLPIKIGRLDLTATLQETVQQHKASTRVGFYCGGMCILNS